MTVNTELTRAVETLINAGCHYRLDELAECYADDLQIVILQENGETAAFDYEQNMAFFRNLRDSGAPPLNTAAQHRRNLQPRAGTGRHRLCTRHPPHGFGRRRTNRRVHPDAAARSRPLARVPRTCGGERKGRLKSCNAGRVGVNPPFLMQSETAG